MPDFQIKKNSKSYDVCIVGSGAGGGMAAYVLAKAGAKVVLLEAGLMYDRKKNVTNSSGHMSLPAEGQTLSLVHVACQDYRL